MTHGKLLCLVFLVLCCVWGAWVYSMEKTPHAFTESECVDCHKKDPAGNITKQMTAPVIILCKNCHNDILSKGYMHPVNIRPRYAVVPADLPLSPSGEITCATCHDIHSSRMTPDGTKSYFLRRPGPLKKFCESCHRHGVGNETHQSSLDTAHFNSQYVATDTSHSVDAVSRECISCHDGSFATAVMVPAGNWRHGREFIKFDNGEHPIGVDYEEARTSRRNSDLRPIGAVDRRIRFFNGTVGCGSCHDPYSTIEKKLVMSDRGSRLCLPCHNLGG